MKQVSRQARQAKIREIVEQSEIETQEALTAMLRRQHIQVTQATVSRDVKELMLVKVPVGDGRYRYALPTEKAAALSVDRVTRLLRDSVVGLADSENLIVVKTLPGTANAVASVLDGLRWPEIIGTVAGDDSILVVVKPRAAVPRVLEKLGSMISA
ncbi:MAG: arginine repressor [Schwartzia sp.]|nr:arginine repressor [Schwartzia sp. (in: firmicutes)]